MTFTTLTVLVAIHTLPGVFWGTAGSYHREVASFESYDKCMDARDKFAIRDRNHDVQYFCITGVVGKVR